MAALSSAARLAAARRVVVKIGSALLVSDETGRLRFDWLEGLAADVADLRERGKDVVLVSSGSIALGRRVLRLPEGELSLEQSQAAAAVGQIRLAQAYETVLAPHGITTAQVLVTLEDSENRRRYLNTRRTLGTLTDLGVVPIVNENDTVATDEIRYGDNDRLAAQVASMAGADVLVLLSDVDGLYTANPRLDPARPAARRRDDADAGDRGDGRRHRLGAVARRHADEAHRRARRDARGLRDGDHARRRRAAAAGAGGRRGLRPGSSRTAIRTPRASAGSRG